MTPVSQELFVPIDLAGPSDPRTRADSVSKADFDKELVKQKDWVEKRLEKQESQFWQLTVAVVVGFLLALGILLYEVVCFHTRPDKDYLDIQNQYFQEVKELREKNSQSELRIQKEINNLKAQPTPSAPSQK